MYFKFRSREAFLRTNFVGFAQMIQDYHLFAQLLFFSDAHCFELSWILMVHKAIWRGAAIESAYACYASTIDTDMRVLWIGAEVVDDREF